jgi:hypothetical protein
MEAQNTKATNDMQAIKCQSWLTINLLSAALARKFPNLNEFLDVKDNKNIDVNDQKRLLKSLKTRAALIEARKGAQT